jgi:hypothetical protein
LPVGHVGQHEWSGLVCISGESQVGHRYTSGLPTLPTLATIRFAAIRDGVVVLTCRRQIRSDLTKFVDCHVVRVHAAILRQLFDDLDERGKRSPERSQGVACSLQ